ncbi:MAG: insulinase family protein/peptidase M16 [Bacteroidales bacterium]
MIHLAADSPVSYCGYAVHAGARDEDNDSFGLAHFVEHALFKGTAKRKAWHILNRMENVGGELNAYTSKEETFVYSVFMEEHFGRAFELLTDITLHSQFPKQEMEREREVILDEINSYKDNPSELIFDEFENLLFEGHPLGHNILGDEKSLLRFTSATALSFVRRHYAPSNMVLFSMGRLKPEKIVRMAEEAWKGESFAAAAAGINRVAPLPVMPKEKRIRRDTHQTHVLTGGRSYPLFEDRRKRNALFLLNNILGGQGMNSRLNLALREKHGLVYNVESNVTAYTDTGLVSIYFGTEPKNADKALRLVHKELDRLRNEPLTAARLAAAKKQVCGQLGVARDNKESVFLNAGKHFLHHNRYESLPETIAYMEKVTAGDILAVANEIYSPANLSILVFE